MCSYLTIITFILKRKNEQSLMSQIVNVQKKSIRIDMDQQKLLDGCVELVTVNGRPFCLMQDSGFKKILNPILEAFGTGNTLLYIAYLQFCITTYLKVIYYRYYLINLLKNYNYLFIFICFNRFRYIY